MTKARKYSRKNISTAPKTARQYKKVVNQVLWRKYHLRRDDVGLTLEAISEAFTEGELSAEQLVAQVVSA
jgi:hypothetical protein